MKMMHNLIATYDASKGASVRFHQDL